MPEVVLARRALEDLDAIIEFQTLPENTRTRVVSILSGLTDFPRLGHQLKGRWSDHRVLPGPWRWMLLIYRIDEPNDRVVVVTIQDARTSTAALHQS